MTIQAGMSDSLDNVLGGTGVISGVASSDPEFARVIANHLGAVNQSFAAKVASRSPGGMQR